MKEAIYEFFGLAGLDTTAPLTFPDLLVWFVCALAAIFLVLSVFRFFAEIVKYIMSIMTHK